MLSSSNCFEFGDQGFTIVKGALTGSTAAALKTRFEPLFYGKFPMGYPDDWAWRPNFGSPTAPRFLINAWKCDPLIAALVFHPALAKAAALLAGWNGARIANDSLWWKPPGSSTLGFHRDAAEWGGFLVPGDMVSCWIALDDCVEGVGTLEVIPGSHRWATVKDQNFVYRELTGPPYRRSAMAAAQRAGVQNCTIARVVGEAGLCVFMHGLVWHGSEENRSSESTRRAIGIHFLADETKYGEGRPKFIFARYKDDDSNLMSEKHFPITWRNDGYRSPGTSVVPQRSEDEYPLTLNGS
jgi:ectoine hydroxylase-related dioxygenase (phytanoyl-CoA dioxygenase family)